jgi:hypothetical protein
LALFRNRKRENLFADRVFQLFDVKQNGVIEFGEFVRSLSVFHPCAQNEDKMECETITSTTSPAASISASFLLMHDLSPQGPGEKIKITSGYLKLLSDGSGLGCSVVVFSVFIIAVAFKLYDLHQTGYIEREEVFMIHRCTLTLTATLFSFSVLSLRPCKRKKSRSWFN